MSGHTSELSQKYSAAQRTTGVSQISFDLQMSLYNKIFETTNVGPNLDLICIRQSNAVPFCKNYAKLYFAVQHLEQGLNRSWRNFWCPFSHYRMLP